jgi:hypothetical protein
MKLFVESEVKFLLKYYFNSQKEMFWQVIFRFLAEITQYFVDNFYLDHQFKECTMKLEIIYFKHINFALNLWRPFREGEVPNFLEGTCSNE